MKNGLLFLFCGLFTSTRLLAQMSVSDTLYISPGTDFFVGYNSINSINNKSDGYVLNEGQSYLEPPLQNDGILINKDSLILSMDYYGSSGSIISPPGSVVELTSVTNPRDFVASSSKTDTLDVLSLKTLVSVRINMTGNWTVRDSIHFWAGVLKTEDTDTLRLSQTSTKTEGNMYSYISGPVEVALNRELFFPIGDDGQYAPVSVSGLTGTKGYYRFSTSTNVANPITGTSDSAMVSLFTLTEHRYWKSAFINPVGLTMANPKITFTYDDDDEGISQDDFLSIAHSPSYNGLFKSLGVSNLDTTDISYRRITTDTIIDQTKLSGFYCFGERDFVKTKIKVYLEGAFDGGSGNMWTKLNPYDFGDFVTYQYHLDSLYGSASLISGYPKMLNPYNSPAGAVDVVHIYLRTGAAYNTTVDSAYAWLLSNGEIRDFETGLSPYIRFRNKGPGNYYIVVEHRNHLPIMSATAKLSDYSNPITVDLTNPTNVYMGTWGTTYVTGSEVGMIAGNAYEDDGAHEINASDYFVASTMNDLNPESVYYPEDLNLDGVVNAADMIIVDMNSQFLYYSVVPY